MANPIPGSELLGYGIRPFGDFLPRGDDRAGKVCDPSAGGLLEFEYAGKKYTRPQTVGFSEEPSGDTDVDVFSSREDYQNHVRDKLDIDVNYGAFSGGFKLTFDSDFTAFSERTAALVNYSGTLWSMSLDNHTPSPDFMKVVTGLPETFNGQPEFYDFFNTYGAFVVVNVTMGGSMKLASLVERSESSSESSLAMSANAEYDVYFKGSADLSKVEKAKKLRDHRHFKLTTLGGDPRSISTISLDDPGDPAKRKQAFEAFENWKATIPGSPIPVSMSLLKIDAFVGKQKKAVIAAALQSYLGGTVTVESTWIDSNIVLSGARSNAAAASSPVLHAVVLDRMTLKQEEKKFQAPDPNDPSAKLEDFWKGVHAFLSAADADNTMLLLATQRWPRDRRYFPPEDVRRVLYKHGARDASIDRWDLLTRNVQPCPLAGLSYVLAGSPRQNSGTDAFAAGFGVPDSNTLTPTAKVSVLLPRDTSTGKIKVVADEKPLEDSRTDLYIIQNHLAPNPVLSADAGGRRVLLKPEDHSKPEQYWYFYSAGARYTWQPVALINFLTCGAVAGKVGGQDEAELHRVEFPMQDDVLWDYRGNDQTANMLLLHYNMQNWNLANVAGSAKVDTWEKPGMHWARVRRAP